MSSQLVIKSYSRQMKAKKEVNLFQTRSLQRTTVALRIILSI